MDGLFKVKFLVMLFVSVYNCDYFFSKYFGYNFVLEDIRGILRFSFLRFDL